FPGEQSAFSENSSQQEKVVRYAFTSFFADADLSFAQGALDLWGKKIGQRAGFDSKCFMFDTIDILSEKIRNNEIDIASTSSVDYIRLKKTLDIELLYTRIKNGKLKDSYYVLGRKDANISTISQLKGKRIILNKSDILGKYYLNTLLLKEFQKEIPDIFSSIDYQEKSSQNLYSLFFGKADVCVVFKNTFDLLCDLNPQIKESV
ncbi:ABC transporter substrate-binding protein, partial [Candidatus Magnetomorum sp. HK-1]